MKGLKWQIVEYYGQYVVYIDGRFFCTAATYVDAVKELQKDGYVH